MTRELFGTDGVRGEAGKYPLDQATVKTVGRAVGTIFSDAQKPFLVGHDPRESSPEIVDALVDGLVSVGASVKLVGVIPTPGLAYLTRTTGAAAGVMVTASHNPYSDNGIKVFKSGGRKLTDDEETELNKAINEAKFTAAEGKSESDSELAVNYKDFLVSSAKGLRFDGLKVAVDAANGAASSIASQVFEELGAEVTSMFNQPDGRNINDGCGATDIAALQSKVTSEKLDAGVAVDGDADRLMMVDAKGREFNGDHILYILAVTSGVPAIAATVMSNFGLETSLKAKGIEMLRTDVGDRYVLDELNEKDLTLGGEQSGHIIIKDLQPTGDGLLAAIQVLAEAQKSGKSLSLWRDEVELMPQAIVNLKVEDKTQIDKPEIQELIKGEAGKLEGNGRLLVRASGTEPKIRIMVEGEAAEVTANRITEEIKTALAKL